MYFFKKDEASTKHKGGFSHGDLPKLWDEVCLLITKYPTLEGRFGVFYYYHFPFNESF